jgi:osmotically-inducible protein OsmY
MRRFSIGAILGGLFAFLFDPQSGTRRRSVGVDRAAGFVRRAWRSSERAGRGVSAQAYGLTQKARHLKEEEKPQPDDVTLARKVETEIFGDADVPKGKINVNAENGVVFLRGEADRPELIRDLEDQVKKIPGVQGVQNLLHLPNTPAPNAQTTSERP